MLKRLILGWTLIIILACMASERLDFSPRVLARPVQQGMFFGQNFSSASYPAITIGIHGHHDNGSTSSATTVMCDGLNDVPGCTGGQNDWVGGNATPTLGSTMYCAAQIDGSTYLISSVADNVNSGVYQSGYPLTYTYHYYLKGFYHENVAASPTSITLTGTGAGTHSQLACEEIKNVPTSYAEDSSVIQVNTSQSGSTNPSPGNAVIPYSNGEFIVGGAYSASGTMSAASTYALIDNASTLYPEYLIQTTKASTLASYGNATSSRWDAGMDGFAPNAGGTCGVTQIFTWSGSGATSGSVPASADLLSGSPGTFSASGASANKKPGFATTTSGMTYIGSTGYQPLTSTRTCAFYHGTGSGSLGIVRATSAGTAQSVLYYFDTTQAKVTFWVTMWTDYTPASSGAEIDSANISGGDNDGSIDYVNLVWYDTNPTKWMEETNASGGTSSSHSWVANHLYGFLFTYNYQGKHTIDIYDCGAVSAGNGCPSPTHLEQLTTGGGTSGGGHADSFAWGGSANGYATGYHWYYGASAGDILYGSAITP
jgi:hypothetical protein